MSAPDELKQRIIRQYGFALRDPNPSIRFLALEGLQTYPQEFDGELILPLLNDSDRFVKWKAIQLCGVIGLKNSYQPLVKALSSADLSTRLFAVHSLALSGDPAFLPALIQTAQSELSPKLRQTLVRALHYFGEHVPWDFLAKASRDPDIGVRIDAALVLGYLAPLEPACNVLINLLESEDNNNVFATALLSLGKYRKQPLVAYFQHSLLHSEARIRANAIEALGQLPFPLIEVIVTPFLRDPSNRVKANVMCIFYDNGFGDRISAELDRFMLSPNRWERSSGAWLAGTYRIAQAVRQLIRMLSDEEGVVAGRSAWAIGQIRAPNSFNGLAAAYNTATQWALTHFIKAMGEVAAPADAPRIIMMWSKERSPVLRAQFIDLLSKLRSAEFRQYAAPLAGDADHNIRAASYRYRAAIDGAKANDTLFKGLNDQNEAVRAACGELMLRQGDFRALKTMAELLNDNDKLLRVQKAYSLREAAWLAQKQKASTMPPAAG
ncbi:MAG TPA: HEAT repeat domain-containing protein [Candidatus Ozemobacteraceae bacterium]|nr:HEAT repeat domain-containing protein [Candidatus Ozemobacteraceae bacterium]